MAQTKKRKGNRFWAITGNASSSQNIHGPRLSSLLLLCGGHEYKLWAGHCSLHLSWCPATKELILSHSLMRVAGHLKKEKVNSAQNVERCSCAANLTLRIRSHILSLSYSFSELGREDIPATRTAQFSEKEVRERFFFSFFSYSRPYC
jgi:hypothetical protein